MYILIQKPNRKWILWTTQQNGLFNKNAAPHCVVNERTEKMDMPFNKMLSERKTSDRKLSKNCTTRSFFYKNKHVYEVLYIFFSSFYYTLFFLFYFILQHTIHIILYYILLYIASEELYMIQRYNAARQRYEAGRGRVRWW